MSSDNEPPGGFVLNHDLNSKKEPVRPGEYVNILVGDSMRKKSQSGSRG